MDRLRRRWPSSPLRCSCWLPPSTVPTLRRMRSAGRVDRDLRRRRRDARRDQRSRQRRAPITDAAARRGRSGDEGPQVHEQDDGAHRASRPALPGRRVAHPRGRRRRRRRRPRVRAPRSRRSSWSASSIGVARWASRCLRWSCASWPAVARGSSSAQLPDVLMLVATSLRSGFGLPQALDAVARDAAEPAAKEFCAGARRDPDRHRHRRCSGAHGDRGWTARRCAGPSWRSASSARSAATSPRRSARRPATLRERESLHRQVRTLSAEGRLSAYILIALPIGIFFYMMLVNYEYISLLWTTPLGLVMMLGAARRCSSSASSGCAKS